MDLKVQNVGRLQPRIRHVVTVTNPSHCFAGDGTTVFHKGEDVRQNLAGVVFVGETVDDGNTRKSRKFFNFALLIGANHHDIGHTTDDTRTVLNGF